MAVDDRDYMRRRTEYSPKSFRGSRQARIDAQTSVGWSAPSRWLWVFFGILAASAWMHEQRERKASPDAARAAEPAAATTAPGPWTSVYLCRSWQGAEFWSQRHCQEVQGNILRIHRVSSALDGPTQLQIAQQEMQQARQLMPHLR